VLLSILALIATAVVAYMGWAQGTYRAGGTLVACVVAGAVAVGVCGPAADWLGAADARSVWHYAGDAFVLWAVFCVVFLGLRTLGHWLFRNEPDFPALPDRIGGAVLGAASGYLVAGLCAVLVQMLPTAPDLRGYEAFRYEPARGREAADRVTPGEGMWLAWDRAAIGLFGYLSGGALGRGDASVFHRYGDVYPPEGQRGPSYQAALDSDDVLYYHWYRRWAYIRWRTGSALGPISVQRGGATDEEIEGIPLSSRQRADVFDLEVRIDRVERVVALEGFPEHRTGSGEEFLLLTVRIQPMSRWPRDVDSRQFTLRTAKGARVAGDPLILGRARTVGPQQEIVTESGTPAEATPRGLRFNVPPGARQGQYLADGALLHFTAGRQYETRTLVYLVPKVVGTADLRLVFVPAKMLPAAPPEKAVPAGPPASPPSSAPAAPPAKAPSAAGPSAGPPVLLDRLARRVSRPAAGREALAGPGQRSDGQADGAGHGPGSWRGGSGDPPRNGLRTVAVPAGAARSFAGRWPVERPAGP